MSRRASRVSNGVFPNFSRGLPSIGKDLRLSSPFRHKLDEAAEDPLFLQPTMTLTSGIEQPAACSLTSVHHAPSPLPTIELSRLRQADIESGIKDIASVRVDDSEGSSAIRSRPQAILPKSRKWLEVQFACSCLALFLAGWNDGTNGPLIPRIQRYYNVSLFIDSIFALHSHPIGRRSTSPSSLLSSFPTAWWVCQVREKKSELKTSVRVSLPEQPLTLFSHIKWDSERCVRIFAWRTPQFWLIRI